MAKINEYPQAATINNNDLFVIDQQNNGDHATKSASVSQIADKATSGVQSQIGDLSTLTTTEKSSIVGAVNEAVGAKRLYINTTYQNDLNTGVTLSETIANFRYLRVTLGASSFDNWNLAYVIIPHMRDTTISGYYPFVTNGQAGKWIRLSVSLTAPTTLTVITSSEASVGIYEVVGVY